MIKKTIWRLMERLELDAPYLLRTTGALVEDGWFRSFRENASVDRDGQPIPWISYPAVEFLSRRIGRDLRVFEYGSGASTRWWAARAREVVSVEHDEAWYQRLLPDLPSNVSLRHVPLDADGSYCRNVRAGGPFDVVVIDGRERVECARQSVDALDLRGVIVWDDSDRARYAEGRRFLRERGFRCIEFIGIAPIEPKKKETSIYYRPNNCLGI